jgi:hypothetical protein
MKGLILTSLTLFSVCYCLRFGYIWTAYGHGGQLTGIPFALIMIVLVINYGLAKNQKRKVQVYYVSLFYFLTLALFSITIEIIRIATPNYFELLYVEPNGIVDKVFLAFIATGLIITIFKIINLKNREISE